MGERLTNSIRWLQVNGHDDRCEHMQPTDGGVQYGSEAGLSLDERVFIESSLGAGRSVADVAQRLGRDRSTVHREQARCGERAGYDARSACARLRDGRGCPSWRAIRCWPLRST